MRKNIKNYNLSNHRRFNLKSKPSKKLLKAIEEKNDTKKFKNIDDLMIYLKKL